MPRNTGYFQVGRLFVSCSLNPYLTIHGLRHSFSTHLVEKGVLLHMVQELLGHVHLETTSIYLHIAKKFRDKIESPLEGLDL